MLPLNSISTTTKTTNLFEFSQIDYSERKDELPQMQVSFIDMICLPLYKMLSDTFPWIKPLYQGTLNNRQHWQDLAEKVEMGYVSCFFNIYHMRAVNLTQQYQSFECINFHFFSTV